MPYWEDWRRVRLLKIGRAESRGMLLKAGMQVQKKVLAVFNLSIQPLFMPTQHLLGVAGRINPLPDLVQRQARFTPTAKRCKSGNR